MVYSARRLRDKVSKILMHGVYDMNGFQEQVRLVKYVSYILIWHLISLRNAHLFHLTIHIRQPAVT